MYFLYFLYFVIWLDSPAKSEVCSSKNGLVMVLYTFILSLHLYFFQTFHMNFYAKSEVSSSKNEYVMLNLVFSVALLLLQSCLCLKASR